MIWQFLLAALALNSAQAGGVESGNDYHHIALKAYSESNYDELNGRIGARVCVQGRITISSDGVYFALRPVRTEDNIDLGFSRINSGLSLGEARRRNMVNGEGYTICGTLRDATPFPRCDDNHCRWYSIENAELRPAPTSGEGGELGQDGPRPLPGGAASHRPGIAAPA